MDENQMKKLIYFSVLGYNASNKLSYLPILVDSNIFPSLMLASCWRTIIRTIVDRIVSKNKTQEVLIENIKKHEWFALLNINNDKPKAPLDSVSFEFSNLSQLLTM
jgi:hypothetical protein